MEGFVTVAAVLLLLVAGFAIRLPPRAAAYVGRALSWLVYFILMLIGMLLAQTENPAAHAGIIVGGAIVLFVCTAGCNLAALAWLDRNILPGGVSGGTVQSGKAANLVGCLAPVAWVGAGVLIGLVLPASLQPPHEAAGYAVLLLIFLVGLQLRAGGVSLRKALVSRAGMLTTLVFVLSSWCGGILFALLWPDVSFSRGLALSSGFGWYSLSAVVLGSAYGPVWGSVALLNDLARELTALMFIPALMRRFPTAAVGLGGATSLDFTLPVIQASGGLQAVTLAISFGVLVNLLAPFFMVLFSSFSF